MSTLREFHVVFEIFDLKTRKKGTGSIVITQVSGDITRNAITEWSEYIKKENSKDFGSEAQVIILNWKELETCL